MQLTIKHSQDPMAIGGPKFTLFTRFELDEEEKHLVDRYRVRGAVLVSGDNERAVNRAFKFAVPIAIIAAGALTMMSSSLYTSYIQIFATPIVLFGIAYAVAAYGIYHSPREDVRVGDVLNGRTFRARDVVSLVTMENKIQEMAVGFRHLLDLMKNWNEARVWNIELGAEPQLLVAEQPRAAA